MAATPQYGTVTFLGLETRKNYNVDIYVSDVDKGLVNWDDGNGASSSSATDWLAPEMVTMTDFSILTGTADTKSVVPQSDRQPIGGQRFRYANFLTTTNSRPPINLTFAKGRRIGLRQSA